jgi:hypothetical protein
VVVVGCRSQRGRKHCIGEGGSSGRHLAGFFALQLKGQNGKQQHVGAIPDGKLVRYGVKMCELMKL